MGDSESSRRSRVERERILAAVAALAAGQGGVVSRRQAYDAGLTRGEVRAQIRARRWQRVWSRSICCHTGDVPQAGRWWAAVFEGGDRAMLDGEASLVASGLTHYDTSAIRVSVPRGVTPLRGPGLDIRRTRRWRGDDRAPSGVPRTRVPVAAVRAALWARSDKQASLLLTMPVQQGMTTPELIGRALLDVRRDRRRSFLHSVVLDLLGGARSLGELEFGAHCRRRGLPEPSRQVVRCGKDGRYYLDVCWQEWGVVVVLRLPLLGLRVAQDAFFDQIERALRQRGWRDAA